MKYSITLAVALVANWLLWSGHFENPFLLVLGGLSCAFCLFLATRMGIVDEEGAPVQLGLRPFLSYAPWLIKEIVVSNLTVTKIILSRNMPLRRTVTEITPRQKTSIGRVIMANSITLTPGTVSVNMHDEQITVHALSYCEADDELSDEMDERVRRLEGESS
ncbi:Na+/H+ antiporter subunit E [Roseimaritima ulvae]|uniref:Putative monovalent cation/H+ antiporter subunit E n=1 Tax=Roseimaritima ulvae TaxID=980254 RepID=A0A5B9QN39_9BACT|nr:Na+/H+ antiporter subunit E [Roseimaritima ulvae]QEG38895.1 putative monovalent cation/H+ antiporter subunit E [Roseimaritima ulvae]